MSKVSLIVPVYRAEPWIDECMASIRAQTYKDIELIVIDDPQGSGAAAARNRGLDKANGEYVAFCDADDYLEPDAIERMVDAIDGVDMVAGSFRKFGGFEMTVSGEGTFTKKDVARYAIENLKNPRTNQLLSGCWAKLYRRSLVREFPNLVTSEDMAFNYSCLMRCERIRFIRETVYWNRKHWQSLSTTYDGTRGLFGFLEGLKYARRFLEAHYVTSVDDEIEDALNSSKIYHALLAAERIGPDALEKVFPW